MSWTVLGVLSGKPTAGVLGLCQATGPTAWVVCRLDAIEHEAMGMEVTGLGPDAGTCDAHEGIEHHDGKNKLEGERRDHDERATEAEEHQHGAAARTQAPQPLRVA